MTAVLKDVFLEIKFDKDILMVIMSAFPKTIRKIVKSLNPLKLVTAYSLVLVLLFSFTPTLIADEAPAAESFSENAEDFAAIAKNESPELAKIKSSTSPEAGTFASSGQAMDPEPLRQDMEWEEYTGKLEELRDAYSDGKITASQYNRKVRKLKRKWRKAEQRRGHGYDKNRSADERPIDVRAVQIEKGQIDVGNSSQSQEP